MSSTADYSFPASSTSRIPLAVILAGLAGCTDSIGFLEFSQLFVSFMSGNTTRFGVSMALMEWSSAARVASVIALFCFGAFLGTLIAAGVGRWRLPILLGLQAIIMSFGLLLPVGTDALPLSAYPIVLALGMQNATLQDEGGRSIALTYVTGAVVRFGTGLANLLLHRPAASFWIQAPLWAALSVGAVIGGILQVHFGEMAFLFPIALALGLSIIGAFLVVAYPNSPLIAGVSPTPDAPPDTRPVFRVA
ncbi:DUF1275 domain-containing protein [Methylobacterium sp. C25]|uniref:YoaK family protein n=1 Tax=Methylobacterium sp. C25 TaxID=2721622 RepID=UPI001F36CA9C|nr:YoaK family protein [Methylobacterium sp. C25]MCE4222360.1 DUF1275 domain-containing protein [Methylobacterium sp. C25]